MAVTAVVGAVGAGLAIYGAVKKAQAEKAAKANLANRPNYQPVPEDDSELNLAESQANTGMSDASRQSMQNNAENGLASSENAIMRNGGDANSISAAYDNYQQGIGRNAIYDDQARQQHIQSLLAVQNQYNQQRRSDNDKLFQVNQYAPWADRQQLYSSQIAGGQQTMQQGIGIASNAASTYVNSLKKPGTEIDTTTGGGGQSQRVSYSGLYPSNLQNQGTQTMPADGLPAGAIKPYYGSDYPGVVA